MSELDGVIARIDAVLTACVNHHRSAWVEIDPDLHSVFDEISGLVLGGGKRLRPQFAHWGWVGAGGDPGSDIPDRVGAAIELLHATALFHDDVIDDAATRRGRSTTHRRKADEHHRNGWAGESRRFGEGAAVLIGDVTYVISDSLMDGLSPTARAIWHDLRIEMNIGQYLDTLGSARRERRLEVAERICRLKSAKYTIERPLHLGAVAADATVGVTLMPMFSAYGLPLGDAFQMRDDILGAFGDPDLTGKPVGGDFREGKPTPMLARAMNLATSDQRAVLDLVGMPDLDDQSVAAIQQVVVDTGALEETENVIRTLRDRAIDALDSSVLRGDAHGALVELADAVTRRVV